MTDKEKWTESKVTKESKGKKPSSSWLKPFGLDKVADAIDGVFGDAVQQQTKRRIYLNIAQFIQKKTDSSLPLCISATYILCKEEDKELLRKNPPDPQAQQLAELVKQHILTIKVHYEPIDVQINYLCQTEIYYLSDGKPTVSRIQEQLSWDDLPNEVREQVLRTGEKKQSFRLFPKQE